MEDGGHSEVVDYLVLSGMFLDEGVLQGPDVEYDGHRHGLS